MNRWRTIREIAIELRLPTTAVRKMLDEKTLVGVKLPQTGSTGRTEWRILDPGEKFKAYLAAVNSSHRLEYIPLLTYTEVAALIGVSPVQVRWLAHHKLLPCVRDPNTPRHTLYALNDVREFLWNREKRRGKKRDRVVHSSTIVAWAQRILAQPEDTTQVKDEMETALEALLKLPEPERGLQVEMFLRKVDAISGCSIAELRKALGCTADSVALPTAATECS